MIKLTSVVTNLPIYVRGYEVLALGSVPATDERPAATEVFLSSPQANGAVFVVTEDADAIAEMIKSKESAFESA